MSSYARWLARGEKPAGSPKENMYAHFLRDAEMLAKSSTYRSDSTGGVLTIMTFNVHFWQRGYSGVCLGDARDDVVKICARLAPDILCVQEYLDDDASNVAKKWKSAGYAVAVVSNSPDCHVLNLPERESLHGRRLQTAILYRESSDIKCIGVERVPISERGFVSFAAFAFGSVVAGVYSIHLSVRCPPERRLDEIDRLLRHCDAPRTRKMCDILALSGDFNQPYAKDYPDTVWRFLAEDMKRAKLPLTDGVAARLEEKGFACCFRMIDPPAAIPQITAWNGARVDWCYLRNHRSADPSLEVIDAEVVGTALSDHFPIVARLQRVAKSKTS